jgi:3-methyladenine DNA glycosylase AlkD
MNATEYLQILKNTLEPHANSEEAVFMKKYMKDQFEFFGIKTPLRKELIKSLLIKKLLPSRENLLILIRELWSMPQREYQYVGMVLTEKCLARLLLSDHALFHFMITHKSWWDTVDFIAAHLVGKHLKKNPELVPILVEDWSCSGNLWLQRATLLFQLQYRQATDRELLTRLIMQYRHDQDFFMRKAIGWVLREYSKTDPSWVSHFICTHELSTLSRKEGMKWINRDSELHN